MEFKIRAPRINSTFGFLPTHDEAKIRNQKACPVFLSGSYFLPTPDKRLFIVNK